MEYFEAHVGRFPLFRIILNSSPFFKKNPVYTPMKRGRREVICPVLTMGTIQVKRSGD